MRRLILTAATLASGAVAQVPAAPPTDTPDTVVVTGRSDAVTDAYVDRVARPEPGRQLARWNAPLCIRYDGLDDRFSSYIHGRIGEVADRVRLKMAGPGCSTAVLIKLTDQADALAAALAHRVPPVLGSVTSDQLPSRRTVEALEKPRAIRWLTSSATVNRDGVPVQSEVNALWSPSLIRSPTREDVNTKIVIIDAARLTGVSLDQLADYLAFIVLASPDIAADFSGADSIMALFSGDRDAPRRMTGQDRAFLTALYLIPPDRPGRTQRGMIRAGMKRGDPR